MTEFCPSHTKISRPLPSIIAGFFFLLLAGDSSVKTNMDHTNTHGEIKKKKKLRAQELGAVMNHSELTGPHKQMQRSATSTPTCTYSAYTNHIPSCALACVCVRIMNANKCPWGLICALKSPTSVQAIAFYWVSPIQRVNAGPVNVPPRKGAQWTTLGKKKKKRRRGLIWQPFIVIVQNTQQKGKKKQAKVRSVITSVETN